MHWKLRDQHLETILYIYRLLYQNLMGTTNQKSTIPPKNLHTQKRKNNPNNTKDTHQITREQKRKGRKKTFKNKPKTINKMAIRTYMLTIILNVNKLNDPNKRHRLAEWIQKQDLYICCLQETHFRSRDTYRLKVRGWKKVFHANGIKRKLE